MSGEAWRCNAGALAVLSWQTKPLEKNNCKGVKKMILLKKLFEKGLHGMNVTGNGH